MFLKQLERVQGFECLALALLILSCGGTHSLCVRVCFGRIVFSLADDDGTLKNGECVVSRLVNLFFFGARRVFSVGLLPDALGSKRQRLFENLGSASDVATKCSI